MNERILSLVFKKSTGGNYSFNLQFPEEDLSAEDIKALATAMIEGDVLSFTDGASLIELTKAYVRETTKEEISLD